MVIFGQNQSAKSYLGEVVLAVNSVAQSEIEGVIDCLVKAIVSENRIWIIGNGGSSATASHFAADLMRRGNQNKYRVRAASLSESPTRITAIGNDFGFEKIFEHQISNLANKGDILVSISASGNSPNLIRGLRSAKSLQVYTVSIVGFLGGVLKKESDLCLHFFTKEGAYEAAEDSHSIVCHYIAMNVRRILDEQSNFRHTPGV